MINAVAYARFSTDMQREESIKAQVRAIEDYCCKNGYNLIKVFADRGISGTKDNTPEFQKMIDECKQPSDIRNFDVVIVHKLDKFDRNRFDSAIYKKVLKENDKNNLNVKLNKLKNISNNKSLNRNDIIKAINFDIDKLNSSDKLGLKNLLNKYINKIIVDYPNLEIYFKFSSNIDNSLKSTKKNERLNSSVYMAPHVYIISFITIRKSFIYQRFIVFSFLCVQQ